MNTVGAYQLEGLGSQLFSKIEGDYFTILGLPLLPLTRLFSYARGAAIMTALYGVIGDPIAHSLSPLIHGGWIRDHHLDAGVPADESSGGRAWAKH